MRNRGVDDRYPKQISLNGITKTSIANDKTKLSVCLDAYKKKSSDPVLTCLDFGMELGEWETRIGSQVPDDSWQS